MGALGKTICPPTNNLPERVQEDNNGFHHLMPHLRLGRISGEEFARRRRQSIPVDADVAEEIATNALKPVKKKALVALAASTDKKVVDPVVAKAKARKKASRPSTSIDAQAQAEL